MPIHVGAEIRRMEEEEFKARVYEVMRHVAIRIHALPQQRYAAYRADLQSLLDHAGLRAIQWINITQPEVRFETCSRTHQRKAGKPSFSP